MEERGKTGRMPAGTERPPKGGMPQMGKKPGGPPPGWQPPMADISWVKRKYLDIPYACESRAQCLDIYLPEEGNGPFPVLVYIHGGGFALGDKRDDHMNAYLEGILRGMAVVAVEYRLSGEAVFPAAVLDCREAVRFLKVHAQEYRLDAERIVAIGGSAGGNLAAMLGMNIPNGEFTGEQEKLLCEETPFVKAAVDQFGPMNFKLMDEQARANRISHADHDEPFSPESKYLGCALPDVSDELCAMADPATYISDAMAPMLVQHGTADRLVPYEQSVEFVEAIRKKLDRERVAFVPLEGADHEDKMFFEKENMDLVFTFISNYI